MNKKAGLVAGCGLLSVLMVSALLVFLVTGTPSGETDCTPSAPVTTVSGPQTNGIDTAARAAAAAGWTGEDLVTAVAIAGAESGYNREAANPGSTARGMWQIMLSFHQPKFDGADWRDPYANARVAYQLWRESVWQPWVAYTSGSYQKYLPEAQTAVAALGGDAVPVSATTGAQESVSGPGPQGVGPEGQAAADFIRQEWNFTGTIGGYRNESGSEHSRGLAIDVMLDSADTRENALGDAIAGYFAGEGAAAFGVNNVIWKQRITNAGRGWEWGAMEDRGSYTENHMDHVHIDFHPGGGDGTVPAAAPVAPECAPGATPVVAAGSVVYPVDKDTDSKNYGASGGNWSSTHTGTDFSIGCGTPVVAAHGGTVQIDTTQAWAGLWLVKVSTGPSDLTTWYAHMQEVTVTDGATVAAGQTIGKVGSEGNSTGCHLHFEVHPRNGGIYEDGVNPSTWLAQNVGTDLGGVAPVSATTGGSGEWFRIASFNLLGATHTGPGGSDHPSWPTWDRRLPGAINYLERYSVDVAGMQEFQVPQVQGFRRLVGGRWGVWGPQGTRYRDNHVVWRTDVFQFVGANTFPIRYFHGQTRHMPVVRLRSAQGDIIVANVHNPADSLGPAQRWRDVDKQRELALVTNLRQRYDVPVFIVGDFNERESMFCDMTRTGVLHSASGGSTGTPCQPPKQSAIDWILGTRDVRFTGFVYDRTPPEHHITDHPIVVAAVAPR